MAEEVQLTQEEKDDQIINEAFQKLLNDYISSRHRKKVDLITKAFNFARQAHKGVRRLSGEPYIMHPIAVAQIACKEVDWAQQVSVPHCCTMLLRIPTTPLRTSRTSSVQRLHRLLTDLQRSVVVSSANRLRHRPRTSRSCCSR